MKWTKNVYSMAMLLLILLFGTPIEAKSKNSRKLTTKFTKGKHKGKKQFFPAGQAGYPGPYPNLYPNPYPNPQAQLKAASDASQHVKVVKGLPAGYDCMTAKYGCCWDGRTPAHGKAGRGCPQCRDVYPDFCQETKRLCHYPMVADYCRVTCKLCSKGKRKKKTCQKSKHNCCWDGRTKAKGPKGKGCPEIKDRLKEKCLKFEAECLRNPYFMWTKCRKTCLRYLPPIEPFLHTMGPSSNLGSPMPSHGQPAMPPGMPTHPVVGPSFPFPFPGVPQGNNTIGRKTTATKKHEEKL